MECNWVCHSWREVTRMQFFWGYSFRLFYFVLCGDFNFVPSYSTVETCYNMVFGIIDLLIISVFVGDSLIWLICPTTPIICLPYYLKFICCLLCLLVVDLVMRLLDLFWVINCFLYMPCFELWHTECTCTSKCVTCQFFVSLSVYVICAKFCQMAG